MSSHDSTKHYVNGPEDFLHQNLEELRDAGNRFQDIFHSINNIVTPPARLISLLLNSRCLEEPKVTSLRTNDIKRDLCYIYLKMYEELTCIDRVDA